MFVLDCSVTMAWCFEDEASDYADAVLTCLETQSALVPRLWHLEVSNVLVIAERRKRIIAEQSKLFLQRLQAIDIQTDSAANSINETDVLQLARQYQLSSYDAVYLSLAQREHLPIATQDNHLRNIANSLGLWLNPA